MMRFIYLMEETKLIHYIQTILLVRTGQIIYIFKFCILIKLRL